MRQLYEWYDCLSTILDLQSVLFPNSNSFLFILHTIIKYFTLILAASVLASLFSFGTFNCFSLCFTFAGCLILSFLKIFTFVASEKPVSDTPNMN